MAKVGDLSNYRCEACGSLLKLFDKRKGLSIKDGSRPDDGFELTYATDLYKCSQCNHLEAI